MQVLCLTRGEASTVHGVDGDLAQVRAARLDTLVDDVTTSLDVVDADGVIVFDVGGVTAHPDHRRGTQAALAAAGPRGLPVLGWTIPTSVAAVLNDEFGTAFSGHEPTDIDDVSPSTGPGSAGAVAATRARPCRAAPCGVASS